MDTEDLNEIMSMRMFKRDALQLIDFYRGWIYRTQRQHFEKLVTEGQEHDSNIGAVYGVMPRRNAKRALNHFWR